MQKHDQSSLSKVTHTHTLCLAHRHTVTVWYSVSCDDVCSILSDQWTIFFVMLTYKGVSIPKATLQLT